VQGPISLAAHASRLVLSLRCASALPLPSFPTLHPKPVTSPVLVFFPQIIERPNHIAHFLNRFSTAPSPAKHRLVGIPPSPRLHEVSPGYCPLTCVVHRTSIPHHSWPPCRHRRRDRALPTTATTVASVASGTAPNCPPHQARASGHLAYRSVQTPPTGLRKSTPHRERGAWR
jgi:hypothetical protein